MGWQASVDGPLPGVIAEWLLRESERIARDCGSVDGCLADGALCIERCGKAIHEATGMNHYGHDHATPLEVESAYLAARWPQVPTWESESARTFLRAAVLAGLGVWWNW